MSKDTINPKRYIFTEEQLNAYEQWALDRDFQYNRHITAHTLELYKQWLKDNPCPLPNPVEIEPSSHVMSFEEYVAKYYPNGYANVTAQDAYEGYLIGTRSIVPEMTDEEIDKEFPLISPIQQIDTMHNKEMEGKRFGAKWYRNYLRSQINK